MKKVVISLFYILSIFLSVSITYADETQTKEADISKPSDFNIFSPYFFEEEGIVFVSMSDIYPIDSKKPIIERPEGDKYDKLRYPITGQYRKNFLANLNLRETDKLYFHDYQQGRTIAFPIKDLTIVARVNIYRDSLDHSPFDLSDYMIGFNISLAKFKSHKISNYSLLIYIGSKNPFVAKKLKSLSWHQVTKNKFPKSTKQINDAILDFEKGFDLTNKTTGNTYLSQANGYDYYLQDQLYDGKVYVRQLIVVDPKTQKRVLDTFYTNGESTRLNTAEEILPSAFEMGLSGHLFKNKPPVVLGFDYVIFGCNAIDVLNENSIPINCDNRH